MTRKVINSSIAFTLILNTLKYSYGFAWTNWIEGQSCNFYDSLTTDVKIIEYFSHAFLYFCMVLFYISILKTAHGQRNRVQESTRSTAISMSEMKYIKMLLSVLGIFTVCWIPYNILCASNLFTDLNLNPEFFSLSGVPLRLNSGRRSIRDMFPFMKRNIVDDLERS